MKALLLTLFILEGTVIFSQETNGKKDTLDYYDMSLEQLIAMKAHGIPSELEELINSLIAAASRHPLSARESPSIVTLITEEEIRNTGARDLIDVLRLVPGFDFGVDVEGVVGIGTRGLWAHEGKILLLIDGQEMNDPLYGINAFGNHFSVDHIKRIEVIRGPGSATYGGCAEYGVINVITKSGNDLNGISVSALAGQMASAAGRRNFSLSAGKQSKDLQFTLGAFIGKTNQSDRNYTDFFGNTYNMAGNSDQNPTCLNAGLSYKNLSARWILDQYHTTERDEYDTITSKPHPIDYTSRFLELKYSARMGKKNELTITPKFNVKRQTPWETVWDDDSIAPDYSKTALRYTGNITASYNLTRKINFIGGGEAYWDKAEDNSYDSSFFSNGEKTVHYSNQAYFLQASVKTRIVNFIAGARADIHSTYGSAFVPRLGITKKSKKVHFKALYSNSFRAPSIENINLGSSIKPELTRVFEFETGYQLTRKSIVTANVFDIYTKDPIVYFYDDSLQTDNYYNYGETGSKGAEIEYRMRDKWGYLILNYSYYSVAGKERITDYAVPENTSMLLAFPSHKINLNSFFKINKYVGISPSASYIGERYGYTHVDSTGYTVAGKFKPVLLANLFITIRNLAPGLTIGMGCYDLLGSNYKFIQPYNGYHAPLPGPSREFLVKITYESRQNKKTTE